VEAGILYGYPAFVVNSNNEIWDSARVGLRSNFENHVAGLLEDYVAYSTTTAMWPAYGSTRLDMA
jgi:hypothetical protein